MPSSETPQKGLGTGPCGDTHIHHNYFEELEKSPSHGEFSLDGATECNKNLLSVTYNTYLTATRYGNYRRWRHHSVYVICLAAIHNAILDERYCFS